MQETPIIKSSYYDGSKLLSLMDINGNKPEIYICTSNRTAGKTTYFNRLAVNRFLKRGEKFCLVYRFKTDLPNVQDAFFKDIGSLFFPSYIMESKSGRGGIYKELYLLTPEEHARHTEHDQYIKEKAEHVRYDNDEEYDGTACGYAVTLNSADALKRMSHLFSDVSLMLFDEFQSETNHYCDNEVEKLISLHTSFARGQGKQAKYLPLILVGNPVTILNPYYTALGISGRLDKKTRFLRGDGFVMEQGYNESAAQAQKETAFNRAFAKSNYLAYSAMGVYLNDNAAFVEEVKGFSNYVCTLKYKDKNYGVREFPDVGVIYCDDKPDLSYPVRLSVTTADHEINYVMLRLNFGLVAKLRYFFERGCFRFRNLGCKEAIISALSY